ncbi:MAG: Nascent polypeptide-associated complex protein [Thermoplasmata archaeon]|nr:Nascent polypeptide-associated complex protein [Thermoplasmata archaeon]MCI4361617.1 Nascent polypeptide-associated complex protein [Thermoplasmata archaeon]
MIPGGMRNQRQMELAMRRLGMTTEPVENVEEVVIRTRDKEHVFQSPEVTILSVQGVRTYQVVGTAVVRPRTAGPIAGVGPSAVAPPPPPAGPPEEDVQLVMEQANVGHEEAVDALAEADGQPAEAILQLLSRRGPGGG